MERLDEGLWFGANDKHERVSRSTNGDDHIIKSTKLQKFECPLGEAICAYLNTKKQFRFNEKILAKLDEIVRGKERAKESDQVIGHFLTSLAKLIGQTKANVKRSLKRYRQAPSRLSKVSTAGRGGNNGARMTTVSGPTRPNTPNIGVPLQQYMAQCNGFRWRESPMPMNYDVLESQVRNGYPFNPWIHYTFQGNPKTDYAVKSLLGTPMQKTPITGPLSILDQLQLQHEMLAKTSKPLQFSIENIIGDHLGLTNFNHFDAQQK
uniref:Uncharacterized protein n=1 Tax=Rhabditophanes sp. KR3021 TaxID=114890 RepID=A0AC35UA81_9BILA